MITERRYQGLATMTIIIERRHQGLVTMTVIMVTMTVITAAITNQP